MLNEPSQTSFSTVPHQVVATATERSRETRLQRVLAELPVLRQIAAGLFPGKVESEIEEDPEIEGRRYVVFSVAAPSDLKEFLRRQLEWFRLTDELLGDDVDLVDLFPLFS